MRTTLLSIALLATFSANAMENPVDDLITSTVNLSEARIDVSKYTFKLYDRDMRSEISKRVDSSNYGKLVRKAKIVASKEYAR